MASPRVVVVGAGVAGLAVARRLVVAGCEVAIFERAHRPGGRAVGEEKEGFRLEPGAHVFSTSDRRLAALLAEVGLPDELVPLRSGAEGWLRGGWVHESRGEGWSSLARVPGVGWLRALRLLRLERLERRFGDHLDAQAPERAAPHDDRSLADFAALYFGRRVLERWAGPLVACDWLADPEQASRALFLLRHAALRRATPALLRSGAGALGPALARGLDLRLGAEVTRVEGNGPGGALLRFRADEIEGTIGADAVVVATPDHVASRLCAGLLSLAERDFFAGAQWAPAVTLELALGDPVVPRYLRVRVPAEEGSPLASLAIEPGRRDGRQPDGCAVARLVASADWSRAHLDAPDEAIEATMLRGLARLLPQAAERVRFARVARWPRAFPCFPVGRYRALARFAAVQADRAQAGRRVYFAGDWLGVPSVEGAVASGLRAADAVRADLGL